MVLSEKEKCYELDLRDPENVKVYAEHLGNAVDAMEYQGPRSHPEVKEGSYATTEDKSRAIVEFGATQDFTDVQVTYDRPEYERNSTNGGLRISVNVPQTGARYTICLARPRDYSGQGTSPYKYDEPYALASIDVEHLTILPEELDNLELIPADLAEGLKKILVKLFAVFDY